MTLAEILDVLVRAWRLIASFALAGAVAAAVFVWATDEVFQASSTVYVETALPADATESALQQAVAYTNYRTITLERLATSALVLDAVIDNLDLDVNAEELAQNVDSLSALDTSIIVIRTRDSDPVQAAVIANAIAEEIANRFSTPPGPDDVAVDVIVADRASPAATPSSPQPLLLFGLAIFAGVLGGSALALGRQSLNPRINTAGDVQRIRSLPVLAVLPTSATEDEWSIATGMVAGAATATGQSIVLVEANASELSARLIARLTKHGVTVGSAEGIPGDRHLVVSNAEVAILLISRGDRVSVIATALEVLDNAGLTLLGCVIAQVPRRGVDAYARTRPL